MTQPNALRLADALESAALKSPELLEAEDQQAAAELRRLHEANEELVEALISLINRDQIKQEHPNLCASAIAAIAKAGGQQ